jgi:hypothetical protein
MKIINKKLINKKIINKKIINKKIINNLVLQKKYLLEIKLYNNTYNQNNNELISIYAQIDNLKNYVEPEPELLESESDKHKSTDIIRRCWLSYRLRKRILDDDVFRSKSDKLILDTESNSDSETNSNYSKFSSNSEFEIL